MLFRSFIRATKGLGDAQARRETVQWVRVDFERYKDVVESVRCGCVPETGGAEAVRAGEGKDLVGVGASTA